MEPAFITHFPVIEAFRSSGDPIDLSKAIMSRSADGRHKELTGECGTPLASGAFNRCQYARFAAIAATVTSPAMTLITASIWTPWKTRFGTMRWPERRSKMMLDKEQGGEALHHVGGRRLRALPRDSGPGTEPMNRPIGPRRRPAPARPQCLAGGLRARMSRRYPKIDFDADVWDRGGSWRGHKQTKSGNAERRVSKARIAPLLAPSAVLRRVCVRGMKTAGKESLLAIACWDRPH